MAKLVNNTLQEVLKNSVSVYGDKIAYALGDTYKVTYAQLDEKTSELGFYLHSNGLFKGDKVVIIGENKRWEQFKIENKFIYCGLLTV